jgi:hypothetical protein
MSIGADLAYGADHFSHFAEGMLRLLEAAQGATA